MDDDKRVQGFLDLYKQQMLNRRNTQDIEWRANIGFWTLLAGANYFAAQNRIPISLCCAVFVCLLTFVMHAWWLIKIHSSEEADKKLWIRFRGEALHILRAPASFHHEDEHRPRTKEWTWLVPEMWLTFALSALLCFLINTNAKLCR
ncbi:MAG: hypothetical protein WCC97_14385 [Candidatus Acidiferrales bacterium]